MKKGVWMFMAVLLICGFSQPGMAATYDASGQWFIETLPGQTYLGVEIPQAGLNAWIDQTGDLFSFETEAIAELGGITYSGEGTVDGAAYGFDPALSETFNLYELLAINLDLNVILAGFDLTAENLLSGFFTVQSAITPPAAILFEGSRTAVPLPAAAWLFATGLLGLFGLRRRVAA